MVPIMAICYISVALIVMILNISALPGVIASIFSQALDFSAIAGGALGATIMQGVKRGLYSNEAGIGSAPNAAAAADVSHPVKQGLVQMLSVFIDTLLICSATAFMILCSGVDSSAYIDEAGNTMNGAYIQDSLGANFGAFGGYFITAAMAIFAFTTLVGNYFYAEMNISYIYKNALNNKAFMTGYRLLAVVNIHRRSGKRRSCLGYGGRADGLHGSDKRSCLHNSRQHGFQGAQGLHRQEESRKRN